MSNCIPTHLMFKVPSSRMIQSELLLSAIQDYEGIKHTQSCSRQALPRSQHVNGNVLPGFTVSTFFCSSELWTTDGGSKYCVVSSRPIVDMMLGAHIVWPWTVTPMAFTWRSRWSNNIFSTDALAKALPPEFSMTGIMLKGIYNSYLRVYQDHNEIWTR